MTESPRAALGAMAREALDVGNLPLFDHAHSEREAYDGSAENREVQAQLARTYIYDCVFCNRWRSCRDADHRARMKARGYCLTCAKDKLRFARKRLRRYTDLTTGGHIARSAAHWAGNEPMLQRHRDHYRRCEAMRRKLEAAFAAIGVQP